MAAVDDAAEGDRQTPGPLVGAFRIAGMDCAVEEGQIRNALERVVGIRKLRFDLPRRVLEIDAPRTVIEGAVEVIRAAGFDPQPLAAEAGGGQGTAPAAPSRWLEGRRLAMALLLAIAAEAVEFLAPETMPWKGLGLVVAAAAIWLAGFETYTKGWAALRRGTLNINALMSVAVTGAFLIGQWPEAAMVMALYAIAELIEARAADRARGAIKGLLELTPDQALMLQADGSSWQTVPSADVPLGAIVRVRPGERMPLDGTVTEGTSAVNQAPVTGESIPVDKTAGDPVFAGTINETAELQFRVTAAASDTTLARIIHAVEEAQQTRAPTQRFVDRFAAIYTPAVFIMAIAVAVLAPWLFGLTWLAALYKALVLLVVACPCALVISTPVTVVSALAAGAKRGILIKGGTYLEEARKLKAIALDKTGTITEGKPKLVDWSAVRPEDTDRAGSLAASLAARSDHPVSKAIAAGLALPTKDVKDFAALAGRGVQGVIDGQTLVLGNRRLIEERGQRTAAVEAALEADEQQGRTVTLLADESGVLAIFAVADTIKDTSRQAIAELKQLGVTPIMLTGDNQATAKSIAAQAGIDDAQGNLLPEDKLTAIKGLQQRFGLTAMTGDGINDAPALAQADIGIAMGGTGTDIAMEAADLVIMNDNLRRIPETIRLSGRTHTVLWQNISLALGIKAVFMVLAVAGSATMWMAVFADMGATLLVVANGLRLLKAGADDPERGSEESAGPQASSGTA